MGNIISRFRIYDNNIIKFTAICLLLLAGSADLALADAWTYDRLSSSSYGCDKCSKTSYTALAAASQSSAGWGYSAMDGTYTFKWSGEHSLNCGNNATGKTMCVTFAQYHLYKTLPSYSKLVRSATYNLATASSRLYHGCGLYIFDNTADETELDATTYQNNDAGNAYLIKKFMSTNTSGGHATGSGTAAWTWDNKSSSTDNNFGKYITFVFSVGNGNATASGQDWAVWVESDPTETWYFYKYLTYDANEGAGTAMAEQTIENSGTLTANTYTRTGYRFTGWNTQADGKGTSYSDGQSITATLEDKGPVTLYAQWETVAVSISESGYATVFSDKKIQVPAGVEVYGFTYSDGALVQSTMISEGAVLPANNGYLVKASAAGTYYFTPTEAAATAAGSDLTGTAAEISTPAGNVYVWGKPDGYNYGWYKYTGAKIPSGKAYYIKQQ